MQRLVGDLNRLYRDQPALHALDADPAGFAWVVLDDADNSVVAFLRTDGAAQMLAISNFTPVARDGTLRRGKVESRAEIKGNETEPKRR